MNASNSTPNWFIQTLTRADRLARGLLSETLAAGNKRQQTIAATFALWNNEASNGDFPSADLCEQIRTTKTADLLDLVSAELHPDFGALIGNEKHGILSQQLYSHLAAWFECDPSPHSIKALHHGPPLTAMQLTILDALDEAAHSAQVLAIIPDLKVAQQLNDEIALARKLAPKLCDADLKRAVGALAHDYRMFVDYMLSADERARARIPRSLWERLLGRFAFPPPPLAAHPALIPLSTPRAMREAGRVMGNCAERLLDDVALGSDYFYLWAPEWADKPEAFVQLTRTGACWRVERIAGHGNDELKEDRFSLAIEHLEVAGALYTSEWPLRFMCDYLYAEREEFASRWIGVKARAA